MWKKSVFLIGKEMHIYLCFTGGKSVYHAYLQKYYDKKPFYLIQTSLVCKSSRNVLRRARAAFWRERAILSWKTSEEQESHQTIHALMHQPDNLKMSTTHIITFPALLMLLCCKCMMIAWLIIWRFLVYVFCVGWAF